MPQEAGVAAAADSDLEAALENVAAVEELIADVDGDDTDEDAVEALAEAEDIDPDGVLVESPASSASDDGGDDRDLDDEPDIEVLDEDELLDEEPPAPKPESPYDRPGKWYVLHTQSGYEKKVRQNIEARRASMNMESRIHEVVIPMEDVVEFKQNKKVIVQKKMFPGYLLVRCTLDDDSWYVIRNTPGVTGFVGAGNKPQPLPRREVEHFLQVKDETQEKVPKATRATRQYEINETVRVKEGPFADFSGEIVEINEDQMRVKVLVNIFGRETPVELEFSQVAKL
ncbi:MAG: transcription termination/antitermination factor NusG [Actinobacteria bacterium]|nr:transcription termination/antitermination factor NusG [Actinomycetota bacterium]